MKNFILLFALFICNSTIAQISDFKSVDFTIADNIAKLNKGRSLKNLPLLAYNLTNKLPTKVEKFRAIYTWVCNNIEADYYQQEKITRKRKILKKDSTRYIKWNNKYNKSVFKNLLNNKKTMCTGYAYLIKELCVLSNIECEIIDGYGRSAVSNIDKLENANHSWNTVKLNNKWYLCDATWSSGYLIADSFFVNDYNDGYFLAEPLLFAKNHYPLHKKWLLDSTLITSEFIASPLVYSETFKHKIIPMYPEKMDFVVVKDTVIPFCFKTSKTIKNNTISLIEFKGSTQHAFNIYDLKNENGQITFKHKFKRKGFYDVHLKIDNDIVATYVIEVTKS